MIYEDDKKYSEERYGKPYNEILAVAEKNLRAAGVEEKWIKMILDDNFGVDGAYQNNIPKMTRGGDLWLYLTSY